MKRKASPIVLNMKRAILPLMISAMVLSACTSQGADGSAAASSTSGANADKASAASATPVSLVSAADTFTVEDEDASWSSTNATAITFSGTAATVTGNGAVSKDGVVTITAAGTYVVSGTATDGQVVVDTKDDKLVKLVLNGADITKTTGAAIYVKNACKTVLILADGTKNHVADGRGYTFDDTEAEEPDAALFSKSDLSITGSGALTVDAVFRDGIKCKDMLRIASGTIMVNAADCGIKGRDGVAVKLADITINAKGDGLKSTNDKDAQKGTITVLGGALKITSGDDGIDAQTNLLVSDGIIDILSGGGNTQSAKTHMQEGGGQGMFGKGDFMGGNGPAPDGMPPSGGMPGSTPDGAAVALPTTMAGGDDNLATEGTVAYTATADAATAAADSTTNSANGIKAGTAVQIDGGTLTIDSAGDSINSNNSAVIKGGTLSLAAGDDGIHADSVLQISGGELTISQSYEGIESSNIIVDNGTIRITASDDGVNISGGNDSSSANGGGRKDSFAVMENGMLTINGGYMVVDAGGDGLDSNGSICMTGGTVLVNGPTNSGNGALDYNGSFQMKGGFLVAAGSAGMAQAPDSTSTQNTVMVGLTAAQQGGTLVHIQDANGKDVLTFAPSKTFQTLVLSSPSLAKGTAYTVYSGGSSTDTVQDGLYTGGSYTEGTQAVSFTVSDVISSVGSAQAGNPMGGGMGRGGGRIKPQAS